MTDNGLCMYHSAPVVAEGSPWCSELCHQLYVEKNEAKLERERETVRDASRYVSAAVWGVRA